MQSSFGFARIAGIYLYVRQLQRCGRPAVDAATHDRVYTKLKELIDAIVRSQVGGFDLPAVSAARIVDFHHHHGRGTIEAGRNPRPK